MLSQSFPEPVVAAPDVAPVLMASMEFRYYRVGGLGTHVANLAPRLGNRIPLDLVVPRIQQRGNPIESIGAFASVYRVDAALPRPGPDFDLQVWALNDIINNYLNATLLAEGRRYRLIHVHDWLMGYLGNDLHHRHNLPLVVTIHATERGRQRNHTLDGLSERIHLAEWHLAHNADLIIVCSQFMKGAIIAELDAPPDRIRVIPNGVDTTGLLGLHDRRDEWADFRSQWARPDEALVFFLGRLVYEKGPDLVVAAMPEILRHVPNARAVIAGTGPLMEELRQGIEQRGLGDKITLAGFIDDLTRNKLYAVCDAAVFPSRYEPFGIVALEAMAAGAPVVVANSGGLGEVVQTGVTGLCCEPGDAESLADAVASVLLDLTASEVRAKRAEHVVKTEYDWDRIAKMTMNAYRDM